MSERIRYVLLMILLSIVGVGCYDVGGVVSDAATGEPISDARVGLLVVRLFDFTATFEERTSTDVNGEYYFIHNEENPRVSIQAPLYRTETRSVDAMRGVKFDAQLQPIAAIKGAWDLSATSGGETVTIVFEEIGMSLFLGASFFGTADFDFDGSTISVDGILSTSDVIFGDVSASLTLSESGEVLSGTMIFSISSEDECCDGTVTAIRSSS